LEEKKSEDDEIKLAKIMCKMVLASHHDITNKNNTEKIEDIKIFWEDLKEEDRDSLFTQVEKFKDVIKNVKLNIRYPGLSKLES
jgi:N-methylhydantoinase A/oxoprolinase/acetone carboxylase beta subunit